MSPAQTAAETRARRKVEVEAENLSPAPKTRKIKAIRKAMGYSYP